MPKRPRLNEPLALASTAAAEALGVTPDYLRLLVKRGQLTASRHGRRLFFEPAELRRFLADRRLVANG